MRGKLSLVVLRIELYLHFKFLYLKKVINKILQLYQFIVNNGTNNCVSDFDKKRIRVVNLFLLSSTGVILSFCILNIILRFPLLVILDLFIVVLIVASFVFNYFHKWSISKFILLYMLPLYIVIFPMFFGNIGTEYYNFIFLILGFYIINRRINLVFLSLYITVLFSFSKYLINTVSYPEKYEILETIHYYPCIITSAILVAILVSLFKFDTENYQKKIELNQKELDEKIIDLKAKDDLNRILLKELNHRVKNNLQLISSMLNLQLSSLKDTCAKKALEESKNRIVTIALLHQMLYKEGNEIKVNMPEYIKELTDFLKSSILTISNKDVFLIQVEPFYLSLEISVSVGLILNELITNAIKHGYSDSEPKKIIVKAKVSSNNKLFLEVKDNGKKFPKNFSPEKDSNFGLELVSSLVGQFKGTLGIENRKEKSVNISLNI